MNRKKEESKTFYLLLFDKHLSLIAPERYYELANSLTSAELVCNEDEERQYHYYRNVLIKCIKYAEGKAKENNIMNGYNYLSKFEIDDSIIKIDNNIRKRSKKLSNNIIRGRYK